MYSCFCTFPTARFYLSTVCSVSATLGKLLIGKKAISKRSFFHYLRRSSYCRQWFQDYLRLRWGTLLLVCFHSSFRNISEYRITAYIQHSKGFCTGAQKPGQPFAAALVQFHWELFGGGGEGKEASKHVTIKNIPKPHLTRYVY